MSSEPLAPTSISVRVPAKINLSLAVGGLGGDGFHPLVTMFQAVSLFDDVTAAWDEPGQFSVVTTGAYGSELPSNRDNLAVRAAMLLAERFGEADDELGVALTVSKTIPVAAGMAGGSADAAGALLACATLWDLPVDLSDLKDLAAELGSDVPFALVGGNAIGTNRGDKVAQALSRGTFWWVLATSSQGLSTPSVFARYDALVSCPPAPTLSDDLITALAAGDARALAPCLRNDLQVATLDLRPELAALLARGEAAGALRGIVSGSGPTCAFLAATEAEARQIAADLALSGLCDDVVRAHGPVPGAQVQSAGQ